jgi:predicted nucleotidyltransferase
MAEVEAPPGSLVRTVVAHFARELRRRYGDSVREVRLFGSFARGGAHEDSDVNVAVVLDQETYERWRAQERPLVMDIEREGVPL